MQSLNLNNNRLEVLPEPLGDLPSLVKLDVSNNSIRFLPASMGGFRKIQRIDCSNNLLSRCGVGDNPAHRLLQQPVTKVWEATARVRLQV